GAPAGARTGPGWCGAGASRPAARGGSGPLAPTGPRGAAPASSTPVDTRALPDSRRGRRPGMRASWPGRRSSWRRDRRRPCPPNWGHDIRRAPGNAQGVPPPVHVAGTGLAGRAGPSPLMAARFGTDRRRIRRRIAVRHTTRAALTLAATVSTVAALAAGLTAAAAPAAAATTYTITDLGSLGGGV